MRWHECRTQGGRVRSGRGDQRHVRKEEAKVNTLDQNFKAPLRISTTHISSVSVTRTKLMLSCHQFPPFFAEGSFYC